MEIQHSEHEHSQCVYDYLQIDEKNDNELLQTQKYCGGIPKEFTSTNEKIVFK